MLSFPSPASTPAAISAACPATGIPAHDRTSSTNRPAYAPTGPLTALTSICSAIGGLKLDSRHRPVPRTRRAERGEDRPRGRRPVQCVEVHPRRAASQEVRALERCVGHAQVLERVLVVLAGLELLAEVVGNLRPA